MEKNNHVLVEALKKLPQYQPDPVCWELISAELHQDAASAQLSLQLKELPSYQPPPAIWDQIEAALVVAAPAKPAKRVRMWPKIAAAAAIALVFSLAWWPTKETPPTVQLVTSQEIVPAPALKQDWDTDEPSFEEVMQLAANTLFENPEDFTRLKADLNELNEAKAELLELMDAYGKDPKVIRAIGEIERKRSAVLKQVVTLI